MNVLGTAVASEFEIIIHRDLSFAPFADDEPSVAFKCIGAFDCAGTFGCSGGSEPPVMLQ